MKNNISGVGVALVTPFGADGAVDYDALGRVVDHVIEGGVDYLVALGTTAETPTLDAAERRAVVAFVKERNAGRVPLVVGIGGNSTEGVVRAIGDCDLRGVAAVLSVTPYYNKPSQEGLFRHYERVALNSPVPLLLYNVPSRTGVNMTAETTLRIAREVDNVLGIKEACGTVGQMAALLAGRPAGFRVISGDDALALALASLGGDGIISVAANAFPRAMCDMMAAFDGGDNHSVKKLHTGLSRAFDALFAEGNPAGVKGALTALGLIENNLRLPLVPCSAGLVDRFREIIAEGI